MNDIVFKELTALKQDAGPKEFRVQQFPHGCEHSIPSRQAGGMLAKTRGS
jgi:hypothetical protein